MTDQTKNVMNFHGPENAEHEIRKAYNCIIEAGVAHFWNKKEIPEVKPIEMINLYRHAFHSYRRGKRLAAERWARTAKHLSRALRHEAKIAYLEPRIADLPYLEGARDEEYNLNCRQDTTADLLESVAQHVPPGMTEMPAEMARYLVKARNHLNMLDKPNYKHELLRAERIMAAHEYGRVLECMSLAYETNFSTKEAA